MLSNIYAPALGTGNGSNKNFTFSFPIQAKSEIVVVTRTSAGVYAVQQLTTHYTIADADVNNPAGGTVAFITAPASNTLVFISRASTLTQTRLQMLNGGIVDVETLDAVLDQFLAAIQELKSQRYFGREEAVTSGQTSLAVTFDTAMPNTKYQVVGLTCTWATTIRWGSRTTNGFTVNWGTNPAGNEGVVWRVERF